MTVLIVDDEPSMVRLFQQRFRKECQAGDLKLTFASSGLEALDLLLPHPEEFQILLTDVSMPGMSGLTLAKKIRDQGLTLPIYLISAYDEDALALAEEASCVTGFIPKPLNFDRLRTLFLTPSGF